MSTVSSNQQVMISPRQWGLILLLLSPALLASNVIIAKAVVDIIPPFTLAFSRWLVTVLLLLPFVGSHLWRARAIIKKEWRQLLVLGFLGMGVCGAFPYIGAQTTSATNIGLIYAFSPIFIIVFSRLFYAVQLTKRQLLGVLFAFVGVLVIVAKGDVQVLQDLSFTEGDLWIVGAAAGWGFYSLWQGYLKSELSLLIRFSAMAVGGAIVLLPFAAVELYQQLPIVWDPQVGQTIIVTIIFLAVVSSIASYAAYAQIQVLLGASVASLVMYALPLYTAALAWLILDEQLHSFHLFGAALILPGLFLAAKVKRH
ncbi:MAG: DMT family transporter [Oceanospirillaceae bacterium]|nr:DMT family transporter [Oceanospirillaceae bacterium]